jgi:tetratricopeptide (TPR) repeat protein
MIVRRDPRYGYYQRRRAWRVRTLLIFTALLVSVMLIIILNLQTVQGAALQALSFDAVPTLHPAEHAVAGAEAFQRGNMAGAAKQFEIAVRLSSNNVSYLYEYGKTLLEMTDTAGAAEIADRAIAADSNDVRGYALKANALAYSDPTNALIFALQGQEIDRNFAPVYSADGDCQQQHLPILAGDSGGRARHRTGP